MELVIQRNQADVKGLMGGHKGVSFSLSYRLRTTPGEDTIIQRYRLGAHVIARSQASITTVDNMRAGVTETLPSVEILLRNEEVIKQACQDFGVLLRVARSFGGEDVVTIETGLD